MQNLTTYTNNNFPHNTKQNNISCEDSSYSQSHMGIFFLHFNILKYTIPYAWNSSNWLQMLLCQSCLH
jgi:hypothetical protein